MNQYEGVVGGLEHEWILTSHMGIIIPTEELIFFRGVGLNHQSDYFCFKLSEVLSCFCPTSGIVPVGISITWNGAIGEAANGWWFSSVQTSFKEVCFQKSWSPWSSVGSESERLNSCFCCLMYVNSSGYFLDSESLKRYKTVESVFSLDT